MKRSPSSLVNILNSVKNEPSTFSEVVFHMNERNSTVTAEIFGGSIHFLSSVGILVLNPEVLAGSGCGFSKEGVAIATAISCGIVNIFIGFVCNVPFVATPSLATSLYVASYVRSFGLSLGSANLSTFLVGVIYIFCSHRGISQAIEHAFPRCIKHGARYIVTCCCLTCSPFVLVDLFMILLKTTPYFFLPPLPFG